MAPNPSKDEHQIDFQIFSWKGIISILSLAIAIAAFLYLRPSSPKSDGSIVIMPEFTLLSSSDSIAEVAISRQARPYTTNAPTEKYEVIEYTVESGDNLFSIAKKFGIEPETIFWANLDSLTLNPHIGLRLPPTIYILPVNGAYIQFQEGMSLTQLAEIFNVSVENIVNFPGNHLEINFLAPEETVVKSGTMLIIPIPEEIQNLDFDLIYKLKPTSINFSGPGSCHEVSGGPIGDGIFIWPTESSTISMAWKSMIHEGILIGGSEGDPIYAADNGVVVFAGWTEYGNGNMIVIDHNNSWQTTYTHLKEFSVECGDAVLRGDIIGELGHTGNVTEPQLHFMMIFNGTNYNPLDYVSP